MAEIIGTNASEIIIGNDSPDSVYGGNGSDSIVGGDGVDTLYGGNGADIVDGGSDGDQIFGGKGDDFILGGTGAALIWSGLQSVAAYVSPVPSESEPFFETIGTSLDSYPGGGFVQVWHSRESPDIQVQLSDADGNPIGTPASLGPGYEPALAVLQNGLIAVVWQYSGSTWCRILDGQGQPIDSEFEVNTGVFGASSWQSVTALSGGGFVVSFGSDIPGDGDSWGVISQYYGSDGTPIGPNFIVNSVVTDRQIYPASMQTESGVVVFTWSSLNQDGDGYGVFARYFDATGNALSGEFQVNTTATGNQLFPSIIGLQGGSFVIVWSTDGAAPGTFDIVAQKYDASGIESGDETTLMGAISGSILGGLEAVAGDGLTDGGFVIAWEADSVASGSDIFASVFDANLQPTSDVLLVSGAAEGNQIKAAVEGLETGGFVVSWSSIGVGEGVDGVYNRVFELSGESGGNDTLHGDQGSDTLIGGTGDDLLYGGQGSDVFQFAGAFGHDVIRDFQVGIDVVSLVSLGVGNFDEVMELASQTAVGVEITTAGGNILLEGVLLTELGAGSFSY
jgi:RTX calcium-binding nonapeptide repeat (4 copies)